MCGGDGKVIDFVGTCCNGALDASGLCCAQPNHVDDFGVCGGNSTSGNILLDLNVVTSLGSGGCLVWLLCSDYAMFIAVLM